MAFSPALKIALRHRPRRGGIQIRTMDGAVPKLAANFKTNGYYYNGNVVPFDSWLTAAGGTFTRASKKSAETASGNVRWFGTNVPARTNKGLLRESANTNYAISSLNVAPSFSYYGGIKSPQNMRWALNKLWLSNYDSHDITTVSADGGTVSLVARIPGPAGMWVDNDGAIYTSNFDGTVVWKYDAAGNWSVVATGLVGPTDFAKDRAGNLFITDYIASGGKVWRIDAITGAQTLWASGLPGPTGMCIDPSNDNLFITCQAGNIIVKVVPGTSTGTVSTFSSGILYDGPQSICFGFSGNIYVVNINGGTLLELDPITGTPTLKQSGFNAPAGLCYNGTVLLIANSQDAPDNIVQVNSSFVVTSFVKGITPIAVAYDAAGNQFIACTASQCIYKVTQVGGRTVRTVYASGFTNIHGLCFGFGGYLYASDISTWTVYRITAPNTMTAWATTGLNVPMDMAYDGSTYIFCINNGNTRLVKIDSTGTVTDRATGFTDPRSVVFISPNTFVTDLSAATLTKVDNAGTKTVILSGLTSPCAATSDGTYIFVGQINSNVKRVTTAGAATNCATSSLGTSLAFDPSGNLWGTNSHAVTLVNLWEAAFTSLETYYKCVSAFDAAPDGAASAARFWLNRSATTAGLYAYTKQAMPFPAGSFIYSKWFQAWDAASVGKIIKIGIYDGSTLTTETVTLTASPQRESVTKTITGTPTGWIGFGYLDGDSGGTGEVNFIAWGTNAEPGTVVSSLIDTKYGVTTRAADSLTFATGGWINAAGGTLFAAANSVGSDGRLLSLYGAGPSNSRLADIFVSGTTSPRFFSTMTSTIGSATILAGASHKQAARIQLSNYAYSVNGGAPATDTSATALPTPATLEIGDYVGAGTINGYIEEFAYWTQFGTNAGVQAVTA